MNLPNTVYAAFYSRGTPGQVVYQARRHSRCRTVNLPAWMTELIEKEVRARNVRGRREKESEVIEI